MDILVFDQDYDNNHQDYIKPLVLNIEGLNARLYQNFDEAKKVFFEKEFDFVIIDFTTQEGKTLLDYILEEKPKQKTITLGFNLVSSESNCDECEQIHNKRRLIKPVDSVDIYRTIVHFDTSRCQFAHHFEKPTILMDELMHRYECFIFNKETKMIEKIPETNGDFTLSEYLDIIDILEEYKINHTIIGEYKIKIT